MKPVFNILFLLMICTITLQAQRYLGVSPTESGGPLMPEQAGYDVIFYDLALSVNPADSSIAGELTATAHIVQPLEWFVQQLDTVFSVKKVEMLTAGGSANTMHFEHRDGELWTHFGGTKQPGETVQIRVNYSGKPRVAQRPPWVGGFTWAKTEDGQPWIATSVQSDGADLWWPCKDHPSDEPDSMALHITVPKPLVVAANGRSLGHEANEDGTMTYHWFVSTPINNYSMAINIAPYRTIEETYISVSGDTIPVTFWVLPQDYAKGKILMPQIIEHLAWYEKMLGPYPFRADKYGVAHTPFYGMEHQTIIAYGANFSNAPHGYDILHHHELGHEWWGNLVTALDWRDFWLHEGLCSYMHPLYVEHLRGIEAYHNTMGGPLPRIRNRAAIAPRDAKTTKEMYFLPPDYLESEGDIYNKGVWVLHSLRYLMGDEAFFKALRRMAYPDPAMEKITDGSQCRFATTDDFVQICEDIHGSELDWFFEVYVRQPHLPKLNITRAGKTVTLRWETPDNLPFPMPVEALVGKSRRRIAMPNGSATLEVLLRDEVVPDPDNWILKVSE